MEFSIIIPVLNESDRINLLIEHLCSQAYQTDCEIIVVDGGPEGETIKTIGNKDVISLLSPPGRARQMNCGSAFAKGDILIFLHADTRLPCKAFNQIRLALNHGKCHCGAFDLCIRSDRLIFKIIGFMASMRSRLTRLPYGDQSFFVKKDYFYEIGGYKDIPLMEDIEIMQRIKRRGDRICILSDRVSTSPRRWNKEGIVYCTLRNWIILVLYLAGVSPKRLTGYYMNG
ncbi:MAG: TIGR04283 family arsenosugar biosynthesis glycosyltransferase [Thermodesulfobacteriota bacterium]|nr:TIGR04283 family arsenosugar biosynthesis glycosyltransferase [Thermodesulfobacteriota bacterium]